MIDLSFSGGGGGGSCATPGGGMSQSPSFCIDPDGRSANYIQIGQSNNQLTARDVFSRSKNFIKRPSTMMADDEAMSQVAQALESSHHPAAVAAAAAAAAAAAHANSQHQRQQQVRTQLITQSPSIRRDRRQAIVPPKLATDAQSASDDDENNGDEPEVGQLIELEGAEQVDVRGRAELGPGGRVGGKPSGKRQLEFELQLARQQQEELELLNANRRRRSGGNEPTAPRAPQPHIAPPSGPQQQQPPPPPPAPTRPKVLLTRGSQGDLATVCRRYDHQVGASGRPDSQATLATESINSSGSSTDLATLGSGRQSGGGGLSPFGGGGGGGGATSPSASSLGVPFASSSTRRRSSIAVIPQMQICPGDLLVYSKQLIDRMNQSDVNEPLPQFLTIDDKKGKNIWSSFKLCAQFDNRTMRARNELLCSLEDVLASLQPSTFVDEQLSHYKGMLWNEFIYETESRRSASSEGLNSICGGGGAIEEDNSHTNKAGDATNNSRPSYRDDLVEIRVDSASPNHQPGQPAVTISHTGSPRPTGTPTNKEQQQLQTRPQDSNNGGGGGGSNNISQHVTNGTSPNHHHQHQAPPAPVAPSAPAPSGGRTPAGRSFSSRFREKPKLKRGQTVDSVFRIPLIPSSPLKHAQQHQQTPTAHLDTHHDLVTTIECDERSSISSTGTTPADAVSRQELRRKRSSSTRSRNGSRMNNNNKNINDNNNNNDSNNYNDIGGGGGGDKLVSEHALNLADNRSQESSSFEADDASDLLMGNYNNNNTKQQLQRSSRQTPNQMVRQSSLSTLSSTMTRTEQKRQRALWDLFQSECTFFFDHLMTLKNVYMEPLKKIQVEGFAMFADPDVLFGNLDELCCGVYDFCKEFLYIIMRTLKTRPEELNATDVLIKLYKKNPKIDHMRAVYHRYTLNYINALTYLESLRRQVEFVEFEKWSSRDVRCKKLQLTDLLVAPVQHIMRVPIILKDIESHTENSRDRDEIRAILAVEEASLRELDDKMRWLKNFERLLEIQKSISWPSVLDMEPKLYIPEFLKEVLSKQPCEKLIVSPRRQIVHEGTLSNFDLGKACDLHVILFDDMLLMTRKKKGLTKKSSTVCKTNSGGPSSKDDGSFKYIIYKQPLSLDRFYVHDVQQTDAQAIGIKFLFLLIVMNRFQQIINVHSFSAPNEDIKQTWLFKMKKTAERWKRNFPSGPTGDHQQQPQPQPPPPQPPPPQQQQPQQQQQQSQQGITSSQSVPTRAYNRVTKIQPLQLQSDTTATRGYHQELASGSQEHRQSNSDTDGKRSSPSADFAIAGQESRLASGASRNSNKQPIELIVTSASESLNEPTQQLQQQQQQQQQCSKS